MISEKRKTVLNILSIKNSCDSDIKCILNELCTLEQDKTITLYAGTYSFENALDKFETDSARFYFYKTKTRDSYVFYVNRMGFDIVTDDKIFKFSHRYLYNKNHLSNCFFGESDQRSGTFFKKKRIQLPFL